MYLMIKLVIMKLLKNVRIVSLEDCRIHDMLILIYNSLHNEAPIFVQELLQHRGYTSLRGKLILKIPKVRTTKNGLNSFKYLASKFWNELSDEERTAKNLVCFKSLIRKKSFCK